MAELGEPIVSFLLERISNLLVEEGKFLHGVSGQAEQLQSELKLMQALLKDADARQDEDAVIREWISQSKDLAYEAENLLETFAFKVASRRGRMVNVLKRYTCILDECYTRHKVGVEIQNLNTRVSNLTKRFQEYGMRTIMERESSSSSSRQQKLIRRTYSHVEEDDFVGLENDVKMLVETLVNEDEVSQSRVVSICGMGGIGKTTIARKVYNHRNVRCHFDGFAWICISQQWQTKEVLQGILLKIIPEKREEIMKYRTDELFGQLYRIQQNRKCLIVLDDIWSTSAWECIKNAFPKGETGSKLLLTTRNKNVALHIGPDGFHHEPRLLSDDQSWELLQKKALRHLHGESGHEDIDKLKELGKEMVKHCGGLPLALVVLGGILATKHHLNDWTIVYHNIKSYLGKGESIGVREGEIQRILALSYNDLPYQLKPCFLYLGIYPEDENIETESLYQIWVAEGMVSKEDRIGQESMMDVAERYLVELVKRCMVHVQLKEKPAYRKFKSCRLHDLMRDLCLNKARDENFLKVLDYRQDHDYAELVDPTSSTSKFHRLVIHLGGLYTQNYVHPKKQEFGHLRSLTFRIWDDSIYEGQFAITKFNNFRMLRALTIEGLHYSHTKNFKDVVCIILKFYKLPIDDLIHLRYLRIRRSESIILPSSIGNLEHLETLDLREFATIWIVNALWKMRRLRHLYLPKSAYDLQRCKLNLVGLNKLEILENFSSKNSDVRYLCKLTSLQVLKATIDGEKDGEEIMNCISNLHHLKQATLQFKNDAPNTGSLGKLFGSNLYHLTLRGPLGMLPDYKSHFFRNLTELSLKMSKLERDPIETLENLPNLRKLWLFYVFKGKEMICHSAGFSQLRFLSLRDFPELEEWRVEEGAIANLSILEIGSCWKLKMIPDGLRFISTLKELIVKNMRGSFHNRIQVVDGQEGEDFDKVRHVPSIVIS